MISVNKNQKNHRATYPIIQAPPVINAITGLGPSMFFGRYKSSLERKRKTNVIPRQVPLIEGTWFGESDEKYQNQVPTLYLFLGRSP